MEYQHECLYVAQLSWISRSSNLITHTPLITSTPTFSCGFSRVEGVLGVKQHMSLHPEPESTERNPSGTNLHLKPCGFCYGIPPKTVG